MFSATVWNTDHAVVCLFIWCPIGLGLTYSLRNYLCIYQFKFCNSSKLIFLVKEIPFQQGTLRSDSHKCLPRLSQSVQPIASAQIGHSALKAEAEKLPEAAQPPEKQKLCSQDRRVPALPLLSAQSILPPHPGEILWVAHHLFGCSLSRQEQFLSPHFPLDSVLLVFTNNNSREGKEPERAQSKERRGGKQMERSYLQKWSWGLEVQV